MATDQRNILAFLGTNADFQSWVDALHAQFLAVGLVQSSDTGQLVSPCVAARPGTSAYAGYRIWRFNDALQATVPIFIKVEYGIGTVADRPALRIQCATGTNGAGTLSGQVQSAAVVCAASASKTTTVTLPSYASGGTGWFHLATNLDSANTNYGLRLFIERPSNGDGTLDGTGFWMALAGGSTAVVAANIPLSGSVPSNDVSNYMFAASTPMNTSSGPNVAMWDAPIVVGGKSYSTKLLCYKHADIGELAAITAVHHGSTHTLMPLGDGGGGQYTVAGAVDAVAIRWE